jgi:hypothetical protein
VFFPIGMLTFCVFVSIFMKLQVGAVVLAIKKKRMNL